MPPILKNLILAGAMLLSGFAANAQSPSPAPSPTGPAPTPVTATPTPSPTPFPLAEITAQIVSGEEERAKIEAALGAESVSATANDEQTMLLQMITSQLSESAKVLGSGPTLGAIRDLETRWQYLSGALSNAKRGLTERVTRCDDDVRRLDDLDKIWSQRGKLARSDNGTPQELRKRMEALSVAAQKTRATVQKRRAEKALLLSLAQEQERKVADTVSAIKLARPKAVGRLFTNESLPIWNEPVRLSAGRDLSQEVHSALDRQWNMLGDYLGTHGVILLAHSFLFVMLLVALYWARKRVRAWADDEPRLRRAALVFEVPISMAIAFALIASYWLYPQPPHLLQAIAGAAALVPAILILRRLCDSHLYPILNALVVFYMTDQLRTVAAPVPVVARLIFIVELSLGIAFLVWLLRPKRLNAMQHEDARLCKVTLAGARVALVIFSAALLSNLIGCVNLGNLLGDAVLHSVYAGVFLYASTRIVDGLIIGCLSTEPLARLGMVQRYRKLIWQRTHRAFQYAALFAWVAGTLNLLNIGSPLLESARSLFVSVNVKTGSVDATFVGQLASFGLVVAAAFLISRFLRFALEEDFYPRIKMERGLSYAVSTMLHYAVLLVGFYAAVSAAGLDMNKFAILAGAFGVGLGFGLQNIISNFVSGVILLFERPVKVGDVVQINEVSGVVDRIGIRASIVRTASGSEIIVPNGKFISDQVTNWTLSNRQRGIEITIGAAYGTDPCRVIAILKKIATEHPMVSIAPTPVALLSTFGPDALEFTLNAWTDHFESWKQIRSDLAVAIHKEFLAEGISIPFPQRDLHLRSIAPELVKECFGGPR